MRKQENTTGYVALLHFIYFWKSLNMTPAATMTSDHKPSGVPDETPLDDLLRSIQEQPDEGPNQK